MVFPSYIYWSIRVTFLKWFFNSIQLNAWRLLFLNVVLSERLCLRNWGVRDGKPKRTRLLWMREVIKRTAWASGCHFAGRFHTLPCTCAVYGAAREAHILSMPPCGLRAEDHHRSPWLLRSAWKYFPLRWVVSFSGLDAMNPIRSYGAANLHRRHTSTSTIPQMMPLGPVRLCWNLAYIDVYAEISWEENTIL